MQFSDKVADMPVMVVQTVQMQFLDQVLIVRSSCKADRGIVPQIMEEIIKQIVVPAPQITEEIIKVIQLVRDARCRSWHMPQIMEEITKVLQLEGGCRDSAETVEVRSCSSSTRWPSSVMAAWRWGARFLRAFSHSVQLDVECPACRVFFFRPR